MNSQDLTQAQTQTQAELSNSTCAIRPFSFVRRMYEELGEEFYKLNLDETLCMTIEDEPDFVPFFEEFDQLNEIHFNTKCRILKVIHKIFFPNLKAPYPVGKAQYKKMLQCLSQLVPFYQATFIYPKQKHEKAPNAQT